MSFMKTKIEEFIKLIDQASDIAEQTLKGKPEFSERLNNAIAATIY